MSKKVLVYADFYEVTAFPTNNSSITITSRDKMLDNKQADHCSLFFTVLGAFILQHILHSLLNLIAKSSLQILTYA